MKKKIYLFLIITIIFIGAIYTCGPTITKEPRLNGSIYHWGGNSYVFNAFTGESHSINWERPSYSPNIMCKGSADTLIIYESSFYNKTETAEETLNRAWFVFYKYCATDSSMTLIDTLLTKGNMCYSMDHIAETNNYVYVGTYLGDKGLFLLDSEFNFIKKYKPIPNFDTRRNTVRVISKDSILLRSSGALWLINGIENKKLLTGVNFILDISHDKKNILICKSEMLYIFNLDSNSLKRVTNITSFFTDACFSLDDKYIAFNYTTDFMLMDSQRLCIYDIENEKILYTKVSQMGGSIFWLD